MKPTSINIKTQPNQLDYQVKRFRYTRMIFQIQVGEMVQDQKIPKMHLRRKETK